MFDYMNKKKKPLSENEKEAKMAVIKKMSDQADSQLGDKLKSLKKVTVASNSPKGLEMGLDKAKEIIGQKGMPMTDDEKQEESHEDPAEEATESPEMEKMEDSEDPMELSEDMSEEEINKKLAELMKLKARMDMKKV